MGVVGMGASTLLKTEESVLSSVPYYDRQRVKDLAKEECPEFGELDWALYFFGEEGPGAPEEKIGALKCQILT